MKRITVLFLTVMLVVGIAGLTQAAKKAKPDPLATMTVGTCGEPLTSVMGEILEVMWTWSAVTDAPLVTQLGGDAVYNVPVDVDDAGETIAAVGFEIVKSETIDSFDNLPGKMVYSCNAANECKGLVFPATEEIIDNALAKIFPEATNIAVLDTPVFSGEVWVKAMNPGVWSTRQNYPQENVCPPVD